MTWDVEFSIGPVQGFVAQSRRTRDLWGSSYLLSYLSACAMNGARAAGGEVVRPVVDNDNLYQWVAGGRKGGAPPFGSLPNHFTVRTDTEPAQAAEAMTTALHEAWREICDAVWRNVVQPHAAKGHDTAAIWERQIAACWEVTWVAGPQDQTDGLLHRRKHWRTHRLSEEPGDKCTVMPDYQELSGYLAIEQRGRQMEFWSAIRSATHRHDLRDDERLCAPALVKRLFTRHGPREIATALDVDRWPSTLYVGAVPWLREVPERAGTEAAAFVGALKKAAPEAIRGKTPMSVLDGLAPSEFFRLDANFYHRPFLESDRLCPLQTGADREQLLGLLDKLNVTMGAAAPVYYAMLVADGDQVGELVRAMNNRAAVARAMSRFAGEVTRIVSDHSGVTVYAGGDDVLAMLPVRSALSCADALARAFADAFPTTTSPRASLSAAVVFAHVRMPVGGVLHHARGLLEDDAKERNGRDSVVATVVKPGGEHCRWITSWVRRYQDPEAEPREGRAVTQLDALARRIGVDRGFSASLLHHTRDTLELLCDLRRWEPGKTGGVPDGLDLGAYVRAEIKDSWDSTGGRESAQDELDELTRLVVDLLPPSPASPDEAGHQPYVQRDKAGLDALLLARFLAGEGREDEHR